MNLDFFTNEDLFEATERFFGNLNIVVKTYTKEAQRIENILDKKYEIVNSVYINYIDENSFESLEQVLENSKYAGILVFSLELAKTPTRKEIAGLTRAFNYKSKGMPVCLLLKYIDSEKIKISLALSERTEYRKEWREGEKIGRVIVLRDINVENTHSAHKKILEELRIVKNTSFKDIYNLWLQKFSIQTLNKNFYKELQDWFYYAKKRINLPYRPEYIKNEEENVKNFLVRMLTRILFCWFVKEKKLIDSTLLEITDTNKNRYKLTNDIENENFLESNSYYRGILQNIFFNALNKRDKNTEKDFKWRKYLHKDFNFSLFTKIPYLNGGIFDCLDEDEYNTKDSIEDSVIKIPNYLFYGDDKQKEKGLNEILKSYYFTLEENTPFEEDIALDPEMLGLVFENLLAELDPNLGKDEKETKKLQEDIRKKTGSYYTPRKVVQEMVNESLFIYLKKHITSNKESMLYKLIYNDVTIDDKDLCEQIVIAIDKFKMLDPACGSGAFLMGMLHKLAGILYLTDENNEKWIDLKLQRVDYKDRDDFKKTLVQHTDNYRRKLGIIRDSIYGIDIQPLAVQITKLRFFISLLIDQKNEITPMPNIETKIICANSLENINPDMFTNESIEKLKKARREYYKPNLSDEEKKLISEEIVNELDIAFPSFFKKKTVSGRNKELIREWFTHATLTAPFFNMDFFYPELKEHGGFDCVIGNPPYGGSKISNEIRESLSIESKDPYGAFIARFLPPAPRNKEDIVRSTPLKDEGVLAFIVSDTFMTIKSHLPLRKQMINNYIHKMIRVHPDTFRATVNTAIIICERNNKKEFNTNHICQMVDMTNISVHKNYSRFTEILHQTEGVDFNAKKQSVSNAEYAIYYYPQQLVCSNSNLPFFVASPKLFALMNDVIKPESQEINNKTVFIRKIKLNEKETKIVKLGDIADVKNGMTTGDNDSYFFQNPEAWGKYRSVNDYKNFILTDHEIEKIVNDDKLRKEIIDKGISKDNLKSSRYFGGRYIVPYDKGGESNAEDGWLPNYYVPINYFIDWSEWAVTRMKTLTIGVRDDNSRKELATVFRNPHTYFLFGISYSFRGEYSPTFRLNNKGPYDVNSSFISINNFNAYQTLLILSSKFIRFLFKSMIQHTVASDIDKIKEIPFIISDISVNSKIVEEIINKQKTNPRYDYASNEQIEMDKLVYEAYGLSLEDIEEVENWYARRYPALSQAQKKNLRDLGKSDDYLVLYGYKEENK